MVCVKKSKNQKVGLGKRKKKKKKKELVGHCFLFAGFLKKCQVFHAHVQYTVIIFFITSNQLFYNRISSFY